MKPLFLSLLLVVFLAAYNSSDDKTASGNPGDVSLEMASVANKAGTPNTNKPLSALIEGKRYKIKSAIVMYSLSGDHTGTQELYFDDYGMKEAKYSKKTMKVMGMEQKSNELQLFDGEYQYNINLDTKTGTKMKNPFLEGLSDGFNSKDYVEIGEKMMTQMGGKKIGTEKILGKSCDVWEVKQLGTKTWVWNGIPLKVTINLMAMKWQEVATSIKENVSIPSGKLMLPNDVKITETELPPGMMNQE